MRVHFFKTTAAGNDFIVIDSRNCTIPFSDLSRFARAVCDRKLSIGADGLIFINNSSKADFGWRFFNSDGSEAEMCGNGARCVAIVADYLGIGGNKKSFETMVGIIEVEVKDRKVMVKMVDPSDLRLDLCVKVDSVFYTVSYVNTGVPHVVIYEDNLEEVDVERLGRNIRFHNSFKPAGTNVNFVTVINESTLKIRTYERGVEGETLACGTGAVASAIISSCKGYTKPPIDVITRLGERLRVYFKNYGSSLRDVYLEGEARIVCEGNLWIDSIAGLNE